MECNFTRFRYGPTIQTIALYPGIPLEELSNILLTVLPVSGKIIGLQDENGAVVPLTLACRSPNILSGCLSVILASDSTPGSVENKTILESLTPSAPPLSIEEENNVEESISPNIESHFGAAPPPFQPSTDPEYDNVMSAEDLQQADNTLDELLRFIAALRVQRVIKKQEADALEELLFNNSSLIFAAYSVAKSAGDAEYLTEVCKDIAQSMMSTAGQSACAAQEDVLQCCDRLYIDNKITDNQLLYLRHLVLIRDEDVAQMYDEFRDNFDVQRLMIGLFRLANLHPKINDDRQNVQEVPQSASSQPAIKMQQSELANTNKEQNQQVEPQREEPRSRPRKENPYGKKKSVDSQTSAVENPKEDASPASVINQTVMLNTLNGIIALMIRTGDITPIEAALLNHMITSQNEFIFAAYEIFQSDGNVVELQDTLARCAKIELKKRGLENQKQESKSTNPQKSTKATGNQRNQRARVVTNQIVSEADDEDSPTSSDDNSQPKLNIPAERSPVGDLEAPQSCDSPTQLSRLLSSLNVTNVWQNTVPTKFIFTVFSATQKRLLSIGQCRALCDLFQAQYDLVRAAWEVFNVQDDTFDFIDTLKRIVRDLNFQDNGNVNLSVADDVCENDVDSDNNNSSKDIVQVMKETENRAKEAREAKSNALAAVAEAKRELLKHSLEIMVKQGLVTTQAASNLYERALKGDPLTDAAIEGYAGDRNIMEFLDTLQILANNTPEALEQMLRSAVNSNEEDEVEEYDVDDNEDDDDDLIEVEDEDESAEIEDEHDDSQFNGVQMELKSFAKEMLFQGDIDRDGYNCLLEMISMNDDRVLAAHDVYRDLQDKDDLFDSLLRISRKYNMERQPSEDGGIEMSELSKAKEEEEANEVEMTQLRNNSRSRKNADESGVELSNFQSRKPQPNVPRPQRPQSPTSVLTPDDQKSILVILINAGVITDAQANQILTLIDNGSREIKLIFKQYEEHRDVHTLIDSLRLASSEAEEVDEEDVEEDKQDEEEDEDFNSTDRVGDVGEDESELDEDEKESIEMKFLNIIQGMSLSHLETAALRLAIARDEPTIRFALETFRINRDEDILMRTLREVAHQTINETLNEAGYDGVEDDSPDQNQPNDEEGSESGDDVEEEENADEDDQDDDDEDDDDDDDVDDEQQSENNAMVSKAARLHIFPILISELLKENVLSSSESKKLLELFQNDDDVINAALDVYDLDSDLSELVDTLQRIVQTSSP